MTERNGASLAQLARDTGGRYTERVNDFTLAYARAQRDAACVYSLGVYVDPGDEDLVGELSVRVTRRGLRLLYPGKYVFRSDETQRVSKLSAAWNAPDLFETGVVRAHAFPLRPASRNAWETLLAVSFPVPLGDRDGKEATREFGATLTDGARVVHEFSRVVTLRPTSADVSSSPTLTFVEPARLEPGRYTLTTVLADPEDTDPDATRITIEVPEVPRKTLFLVDPMLGRSSGADLVIHSGLSPENDVVGSEQSFQPLIVTQLDTPDDIFVLTQACYVGSKKKSPRVNDAVVERVLRADSGDVVGSLDPIRLEFDDGGPTYCQNLVDRFPGGALPDGDYLFEAHVESWSKGKVEPQTLRFGVGVAPHAAEREKS